MVNMTTEPRFNRCRVLESTGDPIRLRRPERPRHCGEAYDLAQAMNHEIGVRDA